MNQSPDAFNQVKAILGKLDRSITEARSRRLGTPVEEPEAVSRTPPQAAERPPEPLPAVPPTPKPATGYAKHRGQFGRAKPLNKPTNGSWRAND